MIDVGSFHGQVAWRIKRVALFLRWFIGCFTHCQEVWEENQMQVVTVGGLTMSALVSFQPHIRSDQINTKIPHTAITWTAMISLFRGLSVDTQTGMKKTRPFSYCNRNFFQDFSSPKSELSLLSKKSLDPTLWTIMSQEQTERVQLISVARMASVANTLPCVLASCEYRRRGKLFQ